MFKQKPAPAFVLSVFVFTAICLLCSVVTAQTQTSGARPSTNFNQAADNVRAAAKKELLDAAKAHRVSIQVDRMLYASGGKTTIVHAPITGIERYRNADFEAGAPILLVIVKSTMSRAIPNGSYVVKAQYKSEATSGKATFTDRNGSVSAQRDLIVRTWEQSGILFPGVYLIPRPVLIPNITSVEVFTTYTYDANGFVVGEVDHYYFNCSGVNGTLLFEMG